MNIKCNNCKFCHYSKIGYLDSSNNYTDIGTRIVKCALRIEELGVKFTETTSGTNYQTPKYAPIGIVGTIKEFDYVGPMSILNNGLIFLDNNNIDTPEWCPCLVMIKKIKNKDVLKEFDYVNDAEEMIKIANNMDSRKKKLITYIPRMDNKVECFYK